MKKLILKYFKEQWVHNTIYLLIFALPPLLYKLRITYDFANKIVMSFLVLNFLSISYVLMLHTINKNLTLIKKIISYARVITTSAIMLSALTIITFFRDGIQENHYAAFQLPLICLLYLNTEIQQLSKKSTKGSIEEKTKDDNLKLSA